jgi:hypothetical protein
MKIFCIGYPRTGTHSIVEALKNLGFNAWHYSTNEYYAFALHILKTKNIDHPIFDRYQAFADTPIFYVYRELDQKYPGSKFILTIRDRSEWVDSMEWMLKYTEKAHPETNEHNRFMWKGRNLEPMLTRHTVDVLNYFSDRLHDVFIRNINAMNYTDLAEFLGREPIKDKFPHLHKRHGNN